MPGDRLVQLYSQMEEITAPLCRSGEDECSQFKGRPFRCCQKQYCDQAAEFARSKYGIELAPAGYCELPFMGPQGCLVPPHLRPVCTLHVCSVSWAGKSHIQGSQEKLQEYFRLRGDILAEAKRLGKEPA